MDGTAQLSSPRSGSDGTWAAELWDYAQAVLGEWQSTKIWQPAQQLRAASHSNARDYAGRFLLELLQNSHDAHLRDRKDGRVHVLLDEDEGPHGTLYVANGGTPFTWARVEAVCKLARSEKTVGEGIGNKGVGFRSILEITDAPEIYSARSAGEGPAALDGYCFRFAVRDDLQMLLKDEDLVQKALKELPPFQIPFPISDLPATCKELSADGHVTVVRIPLRNQASRAAAARHLEELNTAQAPVMLFLDRLDKLVIERRVDGTAERTELSRKEKAWGTNEIPPQGRSATSGLTTTVSLSQVTLGSLGTFIVARSHIPTARLHDTIAAATELGQLDNAWEDWAVPAVVEVALPFDDASPFQSGRIYTFLPLGAEVTAPLRGHLNAPFFTKVDRTDLDRGHPLNCMLFEAAAETCLTASDRLRKLEDSAARKLAVDLITWANGPRSADLLFAAAHVVHGRDFADVPVVPVLDRKAPNRSWDSPRNTVLWPEHKLALLTAEAAEAVGITVADPAVGNLALTRLAKMCKALKCPLEASAEDRAAHVELIVAALPLPASGAPVDEWNGVYADLALLFSGEGEVLRGRKLLLADDGKLHRANGGSDSDTEGLKRRIRREAFFQPVRGESTGDAGLAVPETLNKRLFYLHPDLTWVEEEGHVRRQEARLFLEQSRLVRRFDASSLLDRVRQALSESASTRLREQALRFVFRLYRSRQSAGSLPVRSVGLYVPSAEGPLIKATVAVFGAGWSGTQGDDLASVVAEGRESSTDLRSMAHRLVAPPSKLMKRGETEREWREFLADLGVADGLVPQQSVGAETKADGSALTTNTIVRMAKVSTSVAEQWQPYIGRKQSGAAFPYTPYVGSAAYRLPGQSIAGRLSETGRIAYARLILHGLARWKDVRFTSVWNRDRTGNQDPQRVPTPLAAFVQGQPWLPVRGRGGKVRFVQPAVAWHVPANLEEEPAFAPTILLRLRPLLWEGRTLERLRTAELPTWGDSRDSARLIAALGKLVKSEAVGDEDRPALYRTNERAWQDLTERVWGTPPISLEPLFGSAIVAEQGRRLVAVDFSALRDGSAKLYVAGDRESLAARLVAELKLPLLVVPGAAEKVSRILRRRCPDSVRHVSDANLSVEVDGVSDTTEGLGSALADELPWLPRAVGVLADHSSQGLRPTDTVLTELVAAVRRIRIHRYTSLKVTLDKVAVDLPERQEGMLPVPDPDHPLILSPDVEPSWDFVARLSYAVSHVVNRPEFAGPLKLAARELERDHASLESPTEREFADALGFSVHQVKETVRRIDGSLAGVLERCHPLLVHMLGDERARALMDPPPEDVRAFLARLEPYEDDLPLLAGELIASARDARDVDELRALAGVGFAEFNRTLAGLVPRYHPISRAEAHEESVREFVDLHRGALVDRLRWARLPQFLSGDPIPDWPTTRSLQWITAPSEWALTVDTADLDLLRQHVEQALTGRLGAPAPSKGERLSPMDVLRTRNRALIIGLTDDLVALVKAANKTLPSKLAGASPAEEVTSLLDEAGALDFHDLNADDVVGRLAVLGQWPTTMATASAPEAHGLTSADLDRVRNAVELARTEQAKRNRIISLGERSFDIESGNFTELASELAAVLASNPSLIGGRSRFAVLKPIPPRKTATASGGRPGGRIEGERRLSSAQRSAIGFVGEWYAYHWLREQYPSADETSWASTNRSHVFPGPLGDDSLGYDFAVGSGKNPLMFEVKATQGAGGQIELGETEVRTAQRYGRNDRWRVLVITSVLNPEYLKVRMLPNPFSDRGHGVYREEGGALRFSYRF